MDQLLLFIYEYPFILFFPAALLFILYASKYQLIKKQSLSPASAKIVLICAIVMALYGLLECVLFFAEKMSPGRGVPIRIDIFLVYPIILVFLIGLAGAWRMRKL